jgi:hypothetical protein
VKSTTSPTMGAAHQAAVRAVVRGLTDAPPSAWATTPPLPPDPRSEFTLRPYEAFVEEHLRHIEEIVRTPQTRLLVEVERIHASRARRVPTQALRRLAAHSEDWERWTIHGPRPRFILSELRGEDLDTYENRVVTCLLDQVRDDLGARLTGLRNLLRTLASVLDFSAQARTDHRIARRICALWGENYSRDAVVRDEDRQTVERLENLLRRVLRMQDSPLYRAVPRRANVGRTLRRTNILAHDRRYRHVRLLWDRRARDAAAQESNPEQLAAEHRQLCADMQAFGALLVVRALDQFGYVPEDGDRLFGAGHTSRWVRRGETLALDWSDPTRLRLIARSRTAHVLAIPEVLAVDLDADDRIRRIVEKSPAGPMLLLYPQRDDGEETPPGLNTVASDPRHRRAGNLSIDLSILPVSPFTLTSVERVARWLRWTLTGADFCAYPPEIIPAPVHRREHVGELPVYSIGRIAWLIRPIPEAAPALLRISQQLASDQARVEALRARLDGIAAGRRTDIDDPRARSRMNQEKTATRHEVNEAAGELGRFEKHVRSVTDARACLARLCECPSCGEDCEPSRFEPLAQGTFSVACELCETRWGTRRCEAGHLVPYIELPDLVVDEPLTSAWVEHTLGREVLALPDVGRSRYLCPVCPSP